MVAAPRIASLSAYIASLGSAPWAFLALALGYDRWIHWQVTKLPIVGNLAEKWPAGGPVRPLCSLIDLPRVSLRRMT